MDYKALYRRYRPRRFDQVIGQDHVTRTLSNEVVDAVVAHAYLFAGPRGTGKTTTARLLAKTLNCSDRQPDGEPCNSCASCAAIDEGTSLDVIELDAASHNKVEDVREIRQNVGVVASAEGAHRIYILDEAHMLSRAAGNALLKTLEEPPAHVVFVLATTEPYKLLDTIRSRTQRFDFHPVSAELLAGHLAAVAAEEHCEVSTAALGAMANHARGSVRDALGLLEQVAALSEGEVSEADVTRVLGLADRAAFRRLVDAVATSDAAAALTLVAELESGGVDLRRLVVDTVALLRGVFLSQHVTAVEEVADASADEIAEWRRAAERLQPAAVLRAIDLLGDALTALREGREERLVVELALMRITHPEADATNEALAARLEKLERQLGRQPASAPTGTAVLPAGTAVPAASQPTDPEPVDSSPTVASGEAPVVAIETIRTAWPSMLHEMREEVGMRSHALLREAVPDRVDGDAIVFIVPAHLTFHLERLRAEPQLGDRLTAAIGARLGVHPKVTFESGGSGADDAAGPQLTPEVATTANPEALLKEQLGAAEIEDV